MKTTRRVLKKLLSSLASPPRKLLDQWHEMHEFNPMLGFRGCRLGILRPEITEMQARAIFQAAAQS